MTAKQMLERIRNRTENPLNKVIEKLKKEFSEYETAYSDPIMEHKISSMDRILSFDSKLGPILDALEK
jgi:arginine utilization protein RocB